MHCREDKFLFKSSSLRLQIYIEKNLEVTLNIIPGNLLETWRYPEILSVPKSGKFFKYHRYLV